MLIVILQLDRSVGTYPVHEVQARHVAFPFLEIKTMLATHDVWHLMSLSSSGGTRTILCFSERRWKNISKVGRVLSSFRAYVRLAAAEVR